VGITAEEESNLDGVWTTAEVSLENAVRYFYSARLSVVAAETVVPVLEYVLGYREVEEAHHGQLFRLAFGDSPRGAHLEVAESPSLETGINAAGTVHHIAFAVDSEEQLLELRQRVTEVGLYPTQIIDRYYFKSVYFRTRAGILFELATSGPGFVADEPAETLGERLSLPPFLEEDRQEIEKDLPPITTK
jgi:glyoxalase family protein